MANSYYTRIMFIKHFCSGICRNQNFEIFEFLDEKESYVLKLFVFLTFFAFPFSPFPIILLQ